MTQDSVLVSTPASASSGPSAFQSCFSPRSHPGPQWWHLWFLPVVLTQVFGDAGQVIHNKGSDIGATEFRAQLAHPTTGFVQSFKFFILTFLNLKIIKYPPRYLVHLFFTSLIYICIWCFKFSSKNCFSWIPGTLKYHANNEITLTCCLTMRLWVPLGAQAAGRVLH